MGKTVYIYSSKNLDIKIPDVNIKVFQNWDELEKAANVCPPTAIVSNKKLENVPLIYLAESLTPHEKLKAVSLCAIGVLTFPIQDCELSKILQDYCKPEVPVKKMQLMMVSQCSDRVRSLDTFFTKQESEFIQHSEISEALSDFEDSQETYSTHYHVTCANNKRANKYSNYDAIIVDHRIEDEFTSFDFLQVIRQTALSPHVPLILLADSLTPEERNMALMLDVVVLPRYVNTCNLMVALTCAIQKHTKSFHNYHNYRFKITN